MKQKLVALDSPPPVVLLGLDFTYNVAVKLTVADVYALTHHPEVPDIYLFRNRPVRKVEICGIVIGKDERENNIIYSVDDGTGVASCVYWFPADVRQRTIRKTVPLGSLLLVNGRVSEFRGQTQITVNTIATPGDPNAEILWWLDVIDLHKNVYSKTMLVPENYMEIVAEVVKAAEDEDEPDPTLDELQKKFTAEVDKALANPNLSAPDFKPLVELFIRSRDLGVFYFKDVLGDPLLEHVAKVISSNQTRSSIGSISKKKVGSLFQQAFAGLVKEGFFYQKNEDEDIYEVISHERNLGAAVLEAVRDGPIKMQQFFNLRSKGLPLDYISLLVREQPGFAHVTYAALTRTIRKLKNDSLIIELGNNEFKSVDF
ncbi:hypothetical protein DFJ73DRAFT_61858 [Zopfochytrium polystomum]|nr:hypothetical protein DFJ73DRAFT_61858 [Zopfochytrium polystomum]